MRNIAEAEKPRAVSLDFDGVLFHRIPAQSDVLRFWSYDEPFVSHHSPITAADRVVRNDPMSLGEELSFLLHTRRGVKPEAAAFVAQLPPDVVIFGNTGRPNNRPMVDMTNGQLYIAGIDGYFEDVLFKPKGVESDESKYWGLEELSKFYDITHYDDNAKAVRRLAPKLPHVRFVIVQDLTSGILFSKKEMEKYPNVARIAMKKDGRIDITYITPEFGSQLHRT